MISRRGNDGYTDSERAGALEVSSPHSHHSTYYLALVLYYGPLGTGTPWIPDRVEIGAGGVPNGRVECLGTKSNFRVKDARHLRPYFHHGGETSGLPDESDNRVS